MDNPSNQDDAASSQDLVIEDGNQPEENVDSSSRSSSTEAPSEEAGTSTVEASKTSQDKDDIKQPTIVDTSSNKADVTEDLTETTEKKDDQKTSKEEEMTSNSPAQEPETILSMTEESEEKMVIAEDASAANSPSNNDMTQPSKNDFEMLMDSILNPDEHTSENKDMPSQDAPQSSEGKPEKACENANIPSLDSATELLNTMNATVDNSSTIQAISQEASSETSNQKGCNEDPILPSQDANSSTDNLLDNILGGTDTSKQIPVDHLNKQNNEETQASKDFISDLIKDVGIMPSDVNNAQKLDGIESMNTNESILDQVVNDASNATSAVTTEQENPNELQTSSVNANDRKESTEQIIPSPVSHDVYDIENNNFEDTTTVKTTKSKSKKVSSIRKSYCVILHLESTLKYIF